ncbi:MAG: exodeoxyribonuclease III [Myxococcales bacterium]|nr:exodeoxyribonuclease III [Myxococcales bacterium]
MRIATWNVNSIRARVERVVDWVTRREPDVLCMQETKVVDDDFPTEELQRLGYAVLMAGQKTYNGVAIVSRLPVRDVTIGLKDAKPNADKRLIAATIGGVRVLSAYIPNGKSVDNPSFAEKLRFFVQLEETLRAQAPDGKSVALCGDFNVAPDERDVHSPDKMRGQLHFHPDEHRALGRLKDMGLVDAYRLHHSEGGRYSWWDYRGGGLQKNEGLRIDLVLLSQDLADRCRNAEIDADERLKDKPSDHVPVVVDLE